MRHPSLSFLLCFIVSCTSSTLGIDYTKTPDTPLATISRSSMTIIQDEASVVALRFEEGFPKTKSANKIVNEIKTISENGQPLLYIVNYADNKGYTIVSATKKYYPILAYVEYGNYSDNSQTGISILLDQYKEAIISNQSLSDIDSLATYRDMWREYEEEIPHIETKSGDLLSLRRTSIENWESQGYDCFSLDERPEGLPESVYSSWCQIAEGVAHPDYDYLSNSIIIRRSNRVRSSVSPMLSTTWNQSYPYNYGLGALFSSDDAAAGCVTIALAQIMKYHKCPSRYNWSNMPNSADSPNSDMNGFLSDLFDDVILLPTSDWSMGAIQPIIKAKMQNSYDYGAALSSHNTINVMNALDNGKPVFMEGSKSGVFSARHAWVCDGYNHNEILYYFELHVLSVVEPLQYEFLASDNNSAASSTFHMNWGHSPSANGWFVDDRLSQDEPWTTARTDMVLTPHN